MRLLPLLPIMFGLLTAPAVAQTPPPGVNDAPPLPQAISSLLSITYACQNISGIGLYNQADDMARKLTQRVTNDPNLTSQFMRRAEDQAKTACPNTGACWRELMDAGTPATTENAKTTCARLSQSAAQTVADAYAALAAKPD